MNGCSTRHCSPTRNTQQANTIGSTTQIRYPRGRSPHIRTDLEGAPILDFTQHSQPASRRPIDVAVGVLVGLRQCTEGEAFAEIAHSVHATGIGLGSLARALVALASGTAEPFPHHAAAQELWGDLVARRRQLTAAPTHRPGPGR
ncbi:ANTAR domain-containing protein [Mycobacterium antarcticum]|uniref:ANTAR domain-containing protein n=1 Tax=unclassified Mycolicibacterium TaxID=2636767 RepID=UPI0032EA5666